MTSILGKPKTGADKTRTAGSTIVGGITTDSAPKYPTPYIPRGTQSPAPKRSTTAVSTFNV